MGRFRPEPDNLLWHCAKTDCRRFSFSYRFDDPTKWQVTWAQIEVEMEKLKTELPLQEIRIEDPGFDYVDVPKVSISGGKGTGAVAECKMVTVPQQVVFNSG